MAEIISNKSIGRGFYLLTVRGSFKGKMGQFYMIRGWQSYPLLSRPISIHDISEKDISFLYRVVGEGTKLMTTLEKGDTIQLQGPYGNGFPQARGRIALVGGGMGIAPLYLTAKTLYRAQGVKTLDFYMGFRDQSILTEHYEGVCDNLHINIDGYVTELIDVADYDVILTCGPQKMMEKLVDMTRGTKTKVFISIEKRMACGIGACLVCSCSTKEGNKKTCKDGPVFLGEDVIFDE